MAIHMGVNPAKLPIILYMPIFCMLRVRSVMVLWRMRAFTPQTSMLCHVHWQLIDTTTANLVILGAPARLSAHPKYVGCEKGADKQFFSTSWHFLWVFDGCRDLGVGRKRGSSRGKRSGMMCVVPRSDEDPASGGAFLFLSQCFLPRVTA